MGYPGKSRKSYNTPRHPWQAPRIAQEVEFVKNYGLRNKKEVWKAYSSLTNYRELARKLLAEQARGNLVGHIKTDSENILNRLKRFWLLKDDANLDDVLALEIGHLLERRLQTQVYKQGLANSVRQARQFIVHGHIAVAGRKTTVPGYFVSKEEEMQIGYYAGSSLSNESHPSRPSQVVSQMIKSASKAKAAETAAEGTGENVEGEHAEVEEGV